MNVLHKFINIYQCLPTYFKNGLSNIYIHVLYLENYDEISVKNMKLTIFLFFIKFVVIIFI